MKAIKNFLIGFAVSFVGSIPLGYLNIIGFEIYSNSGQQALLAYLAGVIIVEAIVIYATLAFAEKLASHKRIAKLIDIFTIFFLIILAVAFWIQPGIDGGENYTETLPSHSFFVIGIILSALNFIQIPFWTGWNLYFVNKSLISAVSKLRYIYIIGTLMGTFSGMMLLIIGLVSLAEQDFVSQLLIGQLIPAIFMLLALYNSYQFYRKY